MAKKNFGEDLLKKNNELLLQMNDLILKMLFRQSPPPPLMGRLKIFS